MKKSTWHPLVVSMETEESVGMSRKSRPRLAGFSGDGHGLSESLLSSEDYLHMGWVLGFQTRMQ